MIKKKNIIPFVWEEFSKKQLKVMTWWNDRSPHKDKDGIIVEGAIRSGKSVTLSPSFVNWAMETFNGRDFAICGKTIGAVRRNVINTLKKQVASVGLTWDENRSDNFITISKGNVSNTFYLFGGKDEASQDLIQGMTLAGILFDEVALMPQSFVDQGCGRCSVEGSKMWFNCNPKGPNHWFKKEYIDKRFIKRLYHLHFLMDDNPTLSKATKERYKRMFFGVFYQRNILGLWVTAEGKIYTTFTKDNIIPVEKWYEKDDQGKWVHPLRRRLMLGTIGVDFGGNKSGTAFNCTMFTRGFREMITVKEKLYKKELTPDSLNNYFINFVVECKSEYENVNTAYCDSAEQILKRGLKNAILKVKIALAVLDAKKKEIIDRIRFYISMFGQHRYFITSDCVETIQAFEDAVWDEDETKKKEEDVRLDDGTTNIDTLDAQEYSTEPYMKSMMDVSLIG